MIPTYIVEQSRLYRLVPQSWNELDPMKLSAVYMEVSAIGSVG